MNLPDHVLDHLCDAVTEPDLSGTRYELVELIDRGGMGSVYRARDLHLDREVALKVIDINVDDADPLISEARLLAKLEHPGIVTLYDAGKLADGRPFCVMRRVEGPRLDEFLRSEPPLSERLSVIAKLCEAAGFAHSRGVIHRDLKPQNIMIGRFGEVIVLDWGAALWDDRGAAVAGAVVGTRRYMSPEQAGGSRVDHRTDIYAIGVLMAEILPESVPRALAAVAKKARAEDPASRYDRAEEIAADIGRFQDRLPVMAYSEAPWETAVRFADRNRVLLLLITTYVVVRVLLFFFRPA
jgi:serine/threonine protein kinase